MRKGKRCPECTKVNVPGAYQCGHCGTNLEGVQVQKFEVPDREQFIHGPDSLVADSDGPAETARENVSHQGVLVNEAPLLSTFFYILSALSLLGGVIFCGKLWPGDPGYGNEWKTIAYIPAMTWLTVGIVQFGLFAAVGLGLTYLKRIADNSDHALRQSAD
ncbi:MAG: zinc ribbon domain-containing protein [Oceanospirillaceae bacterium]|nr:zinc ribbon domain-containing protein [Oceanospirillaceae bacterium]